MAGIGIDLGTYNSVAAFVAADGKSHIVRSRAGETRQGMVFPSFVKFDSDGRPVEIGDLARTKLNSCPQQVVWGVKRLIGRAWGEVDGKETQRFLYPIRSADDGTVSITIGPAVYTPSAISRILLERICEDARNPETNPMLAGVRLETLVITHPAYFTTSQISDTKAAAKGLGFEDDKVLLITEPEATVLAYGVDIPPGKPRDVLVVDWGAGTLDFVIVQLAMDVNGERLPPEYPGAAYGRTDLGGIDMDDRLLAAAISEYGLVDLAPKELGDLRLQLEEAKISLSEVPSVSFFVSHKRKSVQITLVSGGDPAATVTDKPRCLVLETILQDVLDTFDAELRESLRRNGYTPSDVSDVLLVGGPMHMPMVRSRIAKVFSGNKRVIDALSRVDRDGFPVNPMECVARGAAMRASGAGGHGPRPLPPFDYGFALRNPGGMWQGETVIRANGGYPQPASPQSIDVGGNAGPGDAIPVSLFQLIKQAGGQKVVRMGDYTFVPAVDKGGAWRFSVSLRVDHEGVCTLSCTDARTNVTQHLDHLDKLLGEEIPAVMPLVQFDGASAGSPPASVLADIPSARIKVTTRRALVHVKVARAKAANDPELDALTAKLEAAREALQITPVSVKAFQEAEILCETVRNHLETRGLLSAAEQKVLKS